MQKKGLQQRLARARAVDLWPSVVGGNTAERTAAGPVRDGLLFVKTSDPVLAYQLNMMRQDIMARYQKILGPRCLRGIRFQIGEVPAAEKKGDANEAPAIRKTKLSREKEDFLTALAGPIPQDDVAEAFKRAYRAWAGRRRSGDPFDVFVTLATGQTLTVKEELEKALEAVEPERRREARQKADLILRKRIKDTLSGDGKRDTLAVRNDLRRLALIEGKKIAGTLRETVAGILGDEAAAAIERKQ